jgi:dipeptidyl aminopeptidase/acylaminoacyl peptidase
VSVKNRFGETLVGFEVKPTVQKRVYPTVLLVHGFGDSKEESGKFTDLAGILACEGFCVYSFDFSGRGQSGGDYSKTTLTKLVSDLAVVWRYVASQKHVDRGRIGVVGQSFGTTVVVVLNPPAKCLVLAGSVAHPKEWISRGFGAGYNPNGVSVRIKQDGSETKVRQQFWPDLEKYDLPKLASKIRTRVLFIHGLKDDIIPVSEAKCLYSRVRGTKQLKLLDMDHRWQPNRESVYAEIVDYLNLALKKG